jgi:GxxExxY protein
MPLVQSNLFSWASGLLRHLRHLRHRRIWLWGWTHAPGNFFFTQMPQMTQGPQLKDINDISGVIVGAAYRIVGKLGPGLMESVYERILVRDLMKKGLHVERQKWISFEFEEMFFENAFRVDLIVERAVVVEVKSMPILTPAQHKQLLTYLRLLDIRLGLMLNFGAPRFKDGIKRIANNL